MRVKVVDQIREQLADFLQKYYRDAQIKPGVTGSFAVVLPAVDSYLLPESWDYARIARLARESVNGLSNLELEGHAASKGPVRIPLETIGMNLVHSANGTWLVNGQVERYFSGARLPLGKIRGISDCTVTIERSDDGTLYEFFVEGARNASRCK